MPRFWIVGYGGFHEHLLEFWISLEIATTSPAFIELSPLTQYSAKSAEEVLVEPR